MYIGSTTSRRGPAPPRPTATPPSLPRTPVDQIDSESIHLRSHTPLSLGSIASLHNKVSCVIFYIGELPVGYPSQDKKQFDFLNLS